MVCGSLGAGTTGLKHDFVHGMRRGDVDGIDVVEFSLPYSNHDSFATRTLTFARFAVRSLVLTLRQESDVVFSTTTPLTAGIPGIAARWLGRNKFVFEVRDLWPELPREMGVITNPVALRAMGALEWASYKSATHLIALSPGIAQGIDRIVGDAQRITVVPNGCDLDIFSGEATSWRPDAVADSDLLAVFTGAHGQANGLDAVLDAAAVLMERGRADIKIVLIGDGKLKSGLVRRARTEGLSNVVFHEPVSKREIAGLLDASDVGMQILANVPAFYYGTSPNKFFDYLAAGLPVLNNYPGWLSEIIDEHGCGFVVKPESPALFADALELAADDRAGLAVKAKAAKELAATRFDRTILAKDFVDALENVVGADPDPCAMGTR